MSDIAVRARGLGKTYRLGPGSVRHRTLVDTVAAAAGRLRRPWRRTLQGETFWALRDASFEVREGEVLGIIGRNGAGKSTLLKILSRITPPTAGEAEVVGRLGSLLEVGTGFQGELSGRENIYLNGAIHGMRRAEVSRKLDDIVAFAEIERFLDTPVKHYSSGMYVRLAFAVAAHLDPDILVADEVLAVGDAAFQEKCLGRMREIAGRNRAVLFVTHSMPMVRRLCTRALLVDQGRVVRDGPVDEIVAEYLTAGGAVSGNGVVPEGAPRPVGTGEAFLRRVRLCSSEGLPVDDIFFGQRVRVVVVYDVRSELSDVAVEIGLSTADGLRVVTVSSLDRGGDFLRLAPGTWEIEVDIDANLLPGRWAVDVFMHHARESQLTVDWVERALVFRALDVPQSGGDQYLSFASPVVRGFVRPEGRWRSPVERERLSEP